MWRRLRNLKEQTALVLHTLTPRREDNEDALWSGGRFGAHAGRGWSDVRRHPRTHSPNRIQGSAQAAPAFTLRQAQIISRQRARITPRARRARVESQEGMARHLRVDLGSLTAMRYTVASLRCVPQSMQGVHRIIQSLFLFDVVSGYVKQLPCP